MKIAIPVIHFAPVGGHRVLAELATAWTALGHEVSFLVTQYSDPPYFPTRAELFWLDDGGRRVAERKAEPNPLRRVQVLKLLLQGLNRYCRDHDVVLANHCFTAWPTFLARSRAQKCYYIQAYEPDFFAAPLTAKQKVQQAYALSTYLLPLKRIVNAPLYYSYKALRAKDYVPPGIDLSVFHAKAPDAEGSSRPIIVGCIGRKEAFKGGGYVLRAFEIMRRRGMNVHLQVAYTLPDDSDPPHCRLVKPGNDHELAEFYRSLDVLVAPGTIQLGAPHYPVMEAMACGVPVVTTGYLPAAADNAWLVPTHDASAIADAVADIVAEPQERARRVQQGLRDIQPFAWPEVARKMLDIFQARAGNSL